MFSCPYCKYQTIAKHDLTQHINIHTRSKTFQCKNCTFLALKPSLLDHHIFTKHPAAQEEGEPPRLPRPLSQMNLQESRVYLKRLLLHGSPEIRKKIVNKKRYLEILAAPPVWWPEDSKLSWADFEEINQCRQRIPAKDGVSSMDIQQTLISHEMQYFDLNPEEYTKDLGFVKRIQNNISTCAVCVWFQCQ